MRIFVAGAAGALGKQLIPRLVGAGHEVTGMTRSESKADVVRQLGATPVVADGLDPEQVASAVAEANPEAIVHELTALSGNPDMRRWDRYFALTNRLRTEAHRPPAGSRPRRGRQALRRPELRRLALRAERRTGEGRGRRARPGSGLRDAADA